MLAALTPSGPFVCGRPRLWQRNDASATAIAWACRRLCAWRRKRAPPSACKTWMYTSICDLANKLVWMTASNDCFSATPMSSDRLAPRRHDHRPRAAGRLSESLGPERGRTRRRSVRSAVLVALGPFAALARAERGHAELARHDGAVVDRAAAADLARPVHGGHDLGVSKLKVSGSIGLSQHAHARLHAAQLVGAPPVHPQSCARPRSGSGPRGAPV